MNNTNNDNSLFARWISGEKLTDDELTQLKSTDDLASYERYLKEVDSWSLPNIDSSTFEKINEKTLNKPVKVIPLFTARNILVAASLLLAIGLFSIFNFSNNTTTITTAQNEIKTIELQDGSSIVLNENSSITYSPKNWQENRAIQLNGDAYFEVEKGSPFNVSFKNGNVRVLGTRFEIIAEENLFSTFCYEGKVATKSNEAELEIILTKGMGVIKQRNQDIIQYLDNTKSSPRWTDSTQTKTYVNTPLVEVIHDLKNHFNIEIETSISLERQFTGTFDKSNLEVALKMICLPLNIKYRIISDKKVLLQ